MICLPPLWKTVPGSWLNNDRVYKGELMIGKRKNTVVILVLLILMLLPLVLLAEDETEQLLPLPELIGETLWIETTGRGTFQGMLLTVRGSFT